MLKNGALNHEETNEVEFNYFLLASLVFTEGNPLLKEISTRGLGELIETRSLDMTLNKGVTHLPIEVKYLKHLHYIFIEEDREITVPEEILDDFISGIILSSKGTRLSDFDEKGLGVLDH